MTPDYCELDPAGDVVLILERQHEEDEGEEGVPTDDPSPPTGEAPAVDAPHEWNEWPAAEETPVDDPPGPMEETVAEAVPAYDLPSLTGETLAGEVRDSEKQPESEHIRIRVSSKHLILASPYFRSMLQGDSKEGVDLRTTGVAEIPRVGDHPAALLILLNIIHGLTRRVPRDVDFRMLTQIALLVDKYQFHEVAEMFTDTWVENLKGSMPTTLTDDLRAAICIYWVFRKSSEFKRATHIALMDSNDRIEKDGLPIPSPVFDKINRARQEAFRQCFSTLRGLLEEYGEPDIKCHNQRFDCDAMVYGGLNLRLKSIGYFPIPDSPYRNLCLKDVSQKLRDMHVPTLCECTGRSYYDTTQCGIKTRIDTSINSLEERIDGLDLETFGNGRRS